MPEKKKVRIGVVGAGRWGPNLIRNFHTMPGSEVIAVAEKDPNRLKLIRERYPDIGVTDSAEVVLTDPMIDAAVICTPTSTHHALAQLALRNKKHTFVEKPLARTSDECVDLIRLARKERRVLFVGHVFVYNAGIRAIHKYINSGELGDIYYIHISRTNLGPVREDVSALWDLASHDIAILHYWLGGAPLSVSAVGGRFLSQTLEDAVFATYKFPGNVMANVHVSWLNPKKVRDIVVVGSKKMLVWDDLDIVNPIRIYDKKVVIDHSQEGIVDTFASFHASLHEGDTLIPKIQLNEPLIAECAAFLEAIKKPATSLSSGEEGKFVVDVLCATDESLRDGGREVTICTKEKK